MGCTLTLRRQDMGWAGYVKYVTSSKHRWLSRFLYVGPGRTLRTKPTCKRDQSAFAGVLCQLHCMRYQSREPAWCLHMWKNMVLTESTVETVMGH